MAYMQSTNEKYQNSGGFMAGRTPRKMSSRNLRLSDEDSEKVMYMTNEIMGKYTKEDEDNQTQGKFDI